MVLLIFLTVFSPLVISTKAQFKAGELVNVYATRQSGDGKIILATTVYNGSFDEQDDSLDGWRDISTGNGTKIVEVVDGGGRTSVLHLYAENASRANASQILTHDLDNLERFNFEAYPIGSEIFAGRFTLGAMAYDSDGNELFNSWLTYLIDGEYIVRHYDWRDQTERDEWNTYRFDLKEGIIKHLRPGYSWSDVASVEICFSAQADGASSTYGVLVDNVWAASFIDDNFDDGTINTEKWSTYQNIYRVSEEGGYLRFYGYDASDTKWSSADRERDTVNACEVSARVRHQYMEDEEGQEFEIGFYSPDENKFLILRAHRQSGGGFYYVESFDGTNWQSHQIGDYQFLNSSNFWTWRLIYRNQKFEAWIDGKMVGRVTGFSLTNFYPYIAATDSDNDPNDSIDCQVDDFTFFDLSTGEHDRRYVQSGTFVSDVLDIGFAAKFDSLVWKGEFPAGTSVRMQVRTSWNRDDIQNQGWWGPSGGGTYFTSSGEEFHLFHDGHRYIQIRVEMETDDSTITPELDSIIVFYDSMAVVEADSGGVDLAAGDNSVVQYDQNGFRTAVVYFDDYQPSGKDEFSIAVHREQHPDLSGVIERWWRIHAGGTFTGAALNLFYLNSEVPDTIQEDALVAIRYMSGFMEQYSASMADTQLNYFYVAGLSSLSDWTLGISTATGIDERVVLDMPFYTTQKGIVVSKADEVLLFDASGRRILRKRCKKGTPVKLRKEGVYFILFKNSNKIYRFVWIRR